MTALEVVVAVLVLALLLGSVGLLAVLLWMMWTEIR